MVLLHELMEDVGKRMGSLQSEKVATIDRVYSGLVAMPIYRNDDGVEEEFLKSDIDRGLFTCRSILYFKDKYNNACDPLNGNITYRIHDQCSYAIINPSFLIEDCLYMERVLAYPEFGFGKNLTIEDFKRARNMFLNNNNLYKLAEMFGYERCSNRGSLRKIHQKNEAGPIFPEGCFGELTPYDVFDKLNKYSKYPSTLSSYERAKIREKTKL